LIGVVGAVRGVYGKARGRGRMDPCKDE